MRDLVFLASQTVLCRTLRQQRQSSLSLSYVFRLLSPFTKLVAEFRLSLDLRIISYSNIFLVWFCPVFRRLVMSVAALSLLLFMTFGEAHRL
ncbi:hypothetical protein LIPSTDRAFT_71790 [Lipomyces starkeyi NRRL Y-11557]|uniref:Uncharacterized protein n=1 Tax=Lipomyces starkeyi NRRL Y-11557 TaxID=675824 RepID=A0A1E3Q6T7_LIPST|nr:hypothetical protein LIPSTDRAFT_71790 [Lipomyces starkeyi NRRL Y-11557]